MKTKIVALFGESGAGKDTLQHWLVRRFDNMHGMVSYTSRPKRDYEHEGVEYHFVSRDEFEKYIFNHELLEYTVFNGWFYGTPLHEAKPDKINIGVFNPAGVRKLLTFSSDIEVLPVWVQADDKTRLIRTLEREKNPNCYEICRRFMADKEDFSNIDFSHEIYLNKENDGAFYGIFNRPKFRQFIYGDKND